MRQTSVLVSGLISLMVGVTVCYVMLPLRVGDDLLAVYERFDPWIREVVVALLVTWCVLAVAVAIASSLHARRLAGEGSRATTIVLAGLSAGFSAGCGWPAQLAIREEVYVLAPESGNWPLPLVVVNVGLILFVLALIGLAITRFGERQPRVE